MIYIHNNVNVYLTSAAPATSAEIKNGELLKTSLINMGKIINKMQIPDNQNHKIS